MSSAAKPAAACPVCGKPGEAAYAPFCSRRCADIDLGRWLKGGYVIPGRPEDDTDKGPATPSGKDEPPES
ncbi:MAG: DNA gyrase inhibitor YacG [Alphaproteobacteria bacterium]|nr:DNA gyrase inhibitor YacG [Alphaproteobacteria bacterium]